MGSFHVALLEALVSAGVSPERARAVVDLLDRSIDERYALHAQILATKRDLADLDVASRRDLADLDVAVRRDIGALERNLAERETRLLQALAVVRGDTLEAVASFRVDTLKWILGALTAQTALLLTAAKLF
jgi:hypothetical protein